MAAHQGRGRCLIRAGIAVVLTYGKATHTWPS